jgi:hypothetical protein
MTRLRYSMCIGVKAVGAPAECGWNGARTWSGMKGVTVHRVTAAITRNGVMTATSSEDVQAGDQPPSAKLGSQTMMLFTNTEKRGGRRHPTPLPSQAHDGLAATACHEVVGGTGLLLGHLMIRRSLRDPAEAEDRESDADERLRCQDTADDFS